MHSYCNFRYACWRASVEYFRYFADNPNNLIILSSYQGPGSLGRKLQDGEKVVSIEGERGMQEIKVNMRVELLSGLTPHSGRNELMSFFNNMYPKPKEYLSIMEKFQSL